MPDNSEQDRHKLFCICLSEIESLLFRQTNRTASCRKTEAILNYCSPHSILPSYCFIKSLCFIKCLYLHKRCSLSSEWVLNISIEYWSDHSSRSRVVFKKLHIFAQSPSQCTCTSLQFNLAASTLARQLIRYPLAGELKHRLLVVSVTPREVALVIIQHNDWKQAMRNRTKDGTTINTPMRKLIKKLPGEWFGVQVVVLLVTAKNVSFHT